MRAVRIQQDKAVPAKGENFAANPRAPAHQGDEYRGDLRGQAQRHGAVIDDADEIARGKLLGISGIDQDFLPGIVSDEQRIRVHFQNSCKFDHRLTFVFSIVYEEGCALVQKNALPGQIAGEKREFFQMLF